MIFKETKLKGAFTIEPERFEDDRGYFARTWCRKEFEAQGLDTNLVQCSISFSKKRGTLRGMHYQAAPHEEVKLVRCTSGAIYDVIIDMRPDSQTYRQWVAAELTAENQKMFYIPEGFAHGFITLQDNTEVFYQISEFYYPELSRGVRWNDPAFSIQWPIAPTVMAERDRNYSDIES